MKAMKTIGVLAWLAVSSMVTALLQSWMMQCLWRWFVAREYGSGPSMGAWFGLATIAGFVVHKNARTKTETNHESVGEIIWRGVNETLALWLACVLILGIAWLVGSFLGWIP